MTRRKMVLFFLTAVLVVGVTHLVAAFRPRPSSQELSTTSVGVDSAMGPYSMKTTDELIELWKGRFLDDPKDFISLTYLGQSYLKKGRETGDVARYEKAEAVFRQALSIDPGYEPARADLSAALFVRHDFQDALQLAGRIYSSDPRALQALATEGDAQLELGDYVAAQAAYQSLLAQAPGAATYSRVARLAWLDGRPAEAIDLMQKAVDDSTERGLTGESAAWYDLQLGDLYFNTGQPARAETAYSAALQEFGNYYLALAGMGKVCAAEGRYADAIAYYEQAVAIIPQPDLLAALGDLYSLTDNPAKAQQAYATVQFIGKLQAINQVIYNRQLSLFDSNHETNLVEGLSLAQAELLNRKDVYGYDAAGWALYRNGRDMEALADMQQAMKLGTRDAMLYYHAGMIYKGLGETEQAISMLEEALAINPHFDLLQARIASAALLELQFHLSHIR